jgi:hypothetical protein
LAIALGLIAVHTSLLLPPPVAAHLGTDGDVPATAPQDVREPFPGRPADSQTSQPLTP